MSIKYLLIQPDEDGAPNRFMTEEQLGEWLASSDHVREGWRLQDLQFMTEEELLAAGRDQNYWGDKKRVLLRIEFLQPKSYEVKTKWRI